MNYTIDDILTPLALAVVIDTKVRDPEKSAFLEQARGLIDLFEMPAMSDKDLKAWFKTNRAALAEALNGKRKNTTVLRALTKFQDDLEVENIYEAMVAISVSDKEYVQEESDLIKSAASIWGFRKPPIKVDR